MKILVLGGTYFLGKAFVEAACSEHELILVNRGSREVSFACPEHVRQIAADRHALEAGALADLSCDVAVDFCAYQKGDIRQVYEALNGRVGRYIFVSTSDVYRRGTGAVCDENAPLETRDFGGEAGAYILGKVALERELVELSGEKGLNYYSVRPVFIYGPGNYAPREGMFFHWIEQAGQVLCPEDAGGSFQMVYVRDVADALLSLCAQKDPGSKSFNLCGSQIVTYESFLDALARATGREFERVRVPVADILQKQIPLPFPLTKEESETYATVNGAFLPVSYTPLEEGLRLTWEAGSKETCRI